MKIAAPSGSAPTSTTLRLRLMTDASSKNVGRRAIANQATVGRGERMTATDFKAG